MAVGHDLTFGFQAAPVGGKSDTALYREVVEDCRQGQALGYEGVWLLEHHFSDYYPTPSPLVHMAHIAAACPGLGLGTSVLVLPWYQPLRLAEELAMVNAMTDGPLHIGVGRGTAKLEYDAYSVDMNEARGRFEEAYRIIRTALAGEPFSFEGRYYDVNRKVGIRPLTDTSKIDFFGAIGSPASAAIMGKLGLPPLCNSQFPHYMLAKILGRWRESATEAGQPTGGNVPISAKFFIADTDAEAEELGRKYYPYFFDLQARHYEVDDNHWDGIPEYAAFSKMFANLKAMADPANVGPFMNQSLVGTPETIARRIEGLAEIGFNYFLVSCTVPGVPQSLRHEQYERFAKEVAPHFSAAFRAKHGALPAYEPATSRVSAAE